MDNDIFPFAREYPLVSMIGSQPASIYDRLMRERPERLSYQLEVLDWLLCEPAADYELIERTFPVSELGQIAERYAATISRHPDGLATTLTLGFHNEELEERYVAGKLW